MLQLDVTLSDSYDETTNEFVTETRTLKLEHSLLSLSKWESKYEKPFLSQNEKTHEEIVDYVKMMALEETPPEIFDSIDNSHYEAINQYINAKQTATWFGNKKKPKRGQQTVTSELIYYWITSYEIPWVVETWHINRLFTLIEVFNEERSAANTKDKPKRTSTESLAAERQRINAERRAAMNSSG